MEKTEKEIQAEAIALVEKTASDKANEVAQKSIDGIVAKYEKEYNDKMNAQADSFNKMNDEQKVAFNKQIAEMQSRIKKGEQTTQKGATKSFNDYIAETLKDNADVIKAYKSGNESLAIKVAPEDSLSFTDAPRFTEDVRQGLIPYPANRVWLSDILPQGSSVGSHVTYPKEGAATIEGDNVAALWERSTGDPKKLMKYNLESMTAHFHWLAGFAVVEREMLDDVAWLTSYLQTRLLISLKVAENNFILNGGGTGGNAVAGLLDSAKTYDGDMTAYVDQVIDAAYGQIVENTHEFYQGTTAILNPRDMVKIGLNKATGSGEYDLPGNSVTFSNGKLTIGGLEAVSTTGMNKLDFLTLDKNAVMFLRRMQPEIRMFEDAELAKHNLVMFRIEERATQAIFNDDALVLGTHTPPVVV
jgi:hypothetical protein